MTNAKWQKSLSIRRMLGVAYFNYASKWKIGEQFHKERFSDRKMRLFACACYDYYGEDEDEAIHNAMVKAGEEYADKHQVEWPAENGSFLTEPRISRIFCEPFYELLEEEDDNENPISHIWQTKRGYFFLYDIFGNPFESLPEVKVSNDVTSLAKSFYKKRFRNCEFGVLRDALEEAGNTGIVLKHITNHGHVKGCWLFDSILGKK